MSSACPKCGMPVTWVVAIGHDGDRINVALDEGAVCYVNQPLKGWVRDHSARASHAAICRPLPMPPSTPKDQKP